MAAPWRGGPGGEPTTDRAGPRACRAQAAKGAARFTFDELCGRPWARADYLALARTYHTLFLDRVPLLTPAMANEARRFTL